jgi:hypothetical protein
MAGEQRPKTYVQAFAGRRRAAFWRKLGFPNCANAREKKALLRLERAPKSSETELHDFLTTDIPKLPEPVK